MGKDNLKENSFEGAPGGNKGTLNYQTGYGTPKDGNVVQNPDHFSDSNKTVTHFVPNTSRGSAPIKALPKRPDVKGDQVVAATGTTVNTMQADHPIDPTQQFAPQVDQIFQKKVTPTPDEIMSGLQYELSNMVKKDKAVAKQIVLNHLKGNPRYYSELDMLNIKDKDMKVDESTVSKTKAVLDKMIEAKQKQKSPIATSPELTQIFKDLTDRRMARRTGQG